MTANLSDLQIALAFVLAAIYGCLLWKNGYSSNDRKKLMDGLLWGMVLTNIWVTLCALYNGWVGGQP